MPRERECRHASNEGEARICRPAAAPLPNPRASSVEYVQDVSLELRRLLQSSALPPQERLRILLTAAEMMQRQVCDCLGWACMQPVCTVHKVASVHCGLYTCPLHSLCFLVQGSSVSVEHAGFLTEAYMALQHAVLSPLLEPLPAAGSKAAAAAGGEQDDKEGEQLLAGMLSLQEQTGTKAGEQVRCTAAVRGLLPTVGGAGPWRCLRVPMCKRIWVHDFRQQLRLCLQVCFLVPKVLEALVLESRTLDAARQASGSSTRCEAVTWHNEYLGHMLTQAPVLICFILQGAFVKRMLASAAAAGDTGLAMGLLCLVHRCMRLVRLR